MAIRLRWLTSVLGSAAYALSACAGGLRLVDAQLARRLMPAAARLGSLASEWNVPLSRLTRHLVPLSVGIDSDRRLAEAALVKALGRPPAEAPAEALAAVLRESSAAVQAVHPNLMEELALRGQPLRQQWEAYGPGILAAARRLIEPGMVAESCDVALVLPVLGGGGMAHPGYNLVSIEAVLANPCPHLPEVLRLAWLLLRLTLDWPADRNQPHDLIAAAAPTAMAVIVLAAGAELGLASCDRRTIVAALEAWRLPEPTGQRADKVADWLDAYISARPAWPTAVAGLHQLLASRPPA